jgi:glycosyltransferase involved in cell wall biosynthesis
MRIQVVSPMWPSEASKHTGIFVKNMSEAFSALGFDVDNTAVLAGKGTGLKGRVEKHARLGLEILGRAPRAADILYVHAPTWFSPLVELAALRGDKKLVVHTHGGEVYPHSRMEAATQSIVGHLCRRADLVVAPSRYYAREIARAFGVPEAKLFVSPSGGVDTKRFAPRDRAETRRKLDLPLDAEILGFVGRVVDDKGWDVFIETVAALAKEGRDVHGLVAGDGDDAARLVQRAAALGVGDRLHRLGMVPQPDLPDAYASMDVFLFPTRRGAEALGLVPIEAMASGVPVVGSNGYAVPEYVENGVTGWLAPERDVGAFVERTREILDLDPAERAHMSEASIRAAARYDAENVARDLAERLRELVRAG